MVPVAEKGDGCVPSSRAAEEERDQTKVSLCMCPILICICCAADVKDRRSIIPSILPNPQEELRNQINTLHAHVRLLEEGIALRERRCKEAEGTLQMQAEE